MSHINIPKALSIAGSDSGGGAGIQADIKTMSSLQVYATSVITSVTSQNTLGVNGIQQIPASFVKQQIETVLSDIDIQAIKTGMLSSVDTINIVVETLKQFPEASRYLVVDPVMVSTSGSRLLSEDAIQTYLDKLFPITYIVTPNIPETEVLLGLNKEEDKIKNVNDMRSAAQKLATYGPKYILIKGGHLPQEKNNSKYVIDVLYDASTQQFTEITNHFVDTQNTHGTGCTLSAAIASELAKGANINDAVKTATTYIQEAIATSKESVGKGPGPVNHFHNLRWMPYTGQSFVNAVMNALPEGLWSEFIDHPFVRGLADGTTPKDSFIYYIKQDYLYLQHYARSAALAAYKSKDVDLCAANAKIVLHIHQELQTHLKYCEEWGISKEEVINTTESVFNVAYTRFVLDKGACGDQLDLQVAMAPCLLGYGDIGLKLYNDPNTKREGNPYWPWICTYASDDFQQACKVGRELMENLAIHNVSTSPTRFKELVDTFAQATKLEIAFWEMAVNKN